MGCKRAGKENKNNYHPAARDSAVDSINGVSIQGFLLGGAPQLPMMQQWCQLAIG
jgi:hypothetical protein